MLKPESCFPQPQKYTATLKQVTEKKTIYYYFLLLLQEHPQKETYWGHVNTIGPRACYDESKRVAETMMYAYAQRDKIEIRVARIFNTYGPRMHMYDGKRREGVAPIVSVVIRSRRE